MVLPTSSRNSRLYACLKTGRRDEYVQKHCDLQDKKHENTGFWSCSLKLSSFWSCSNTEAAHYSVNMHSVNNFSPCSYWQSRWDFRQIDGGRRWRGFVGPGEFTRTCGLPCGLLSILRLIEAGDRRNQKMCRSITIDRSHKWFFLRTELNWKMERPNLFRPIKSHKWHIRSLMEVLLWERNDHESTLLKRFCDSSIQ